MAQCGGRTLEAKLSGIFINVFSSRGGHFGRICLHPSVLRSPRPNNNPGGITASPISKQAAYRAPRHTAASNLIQRQSPTHQRDRNQPHLPVGRHQSLPSGSPQQALVPTSATSRAATRSKRGYNSIVCKKDTTPKTHKNEKAEKYNSDRGTRKKKKKRTAK